MLKMHKMYKFPGKVGPIFLRPVTACIFNISRVLSTFYQNVLKIGEMLKMHKLQKMQL